MDIPSWAKPGVKVVCVDAHQTRPSQLTVGTTYTLQSIGFVTVPSIGTYANERCFARLVELANQYHRRGVFALARFRPLITRTQSQDVALIKSLLTDIREGADV